MTVDLWVWPAFLALIAFFLVADLLFFHREAHEIGIKEALIWSVIWTVLGVGFAGVIYLWHGSTAAGEYLAGYVIERSLSVDNIFVFALIFGFFAVPAAYQHRILVWGIVGAVIFRIIFIALGSTLLDTFHWMIFVFGAFLVFTGARMALHKEVEIHPADNPALKLLRRIMPITSDYEGTRFFVRRNGVLMATPLLAVLVTIETTDILFAVDSIPAIFAVTDDAFIVFTSNAFAILGMRVLYFLLANLMHRFIYLSTGLALVLMFVGVKMLLTDVYHMPILLSLGVIAGILTVAIGASLIVSGRREAEAAPKPACSQRSENNMNDTNKVIITTDGSSHSLRILGHAAAFAEATGAGLVLLQVLHPKDDVTAEPGEASDAARARTLTSALQDLAETLQRHGVTGEAKAEFLEGHESTEGAIHRIAAVLDATLIAMHTRGHGALRHAVFGSVAMDVLSHSDTPVMVGGEAINGPVSTDTYRILVATDGSPASETIIRRLSPLIQGRPVALTLMRVYEPQPDDDQAAESAKCAQRLEETRALVPAGIEVETFMRRVPPMGGIDTAIIEKAQDSGASAIALATHGYSAQRHLLAGSTAMRLVGRSPLPIILARSGG